MTPPTKEFAHPGDYRYSDHRRDGDDQYSGCRWDGDGVPHRGPDQVLADSRGRG
jgi:hypothetical protein